MRWCSGWRYRAGADNCFCGASVWCCKSIPGSEKLKGRIWEEVGGPFLRESEAVGARVMSGPDSQEDIESISEMFLCLDEMEGQETKGGGLYRAGYQQRG